MKFRSLIFAVACFGLAGAASAQSLSERSKAASAEDFVRAFLGHCAQNAGYGGRTVAAAKTLGLGAVPEELAPLYAPLNPAAKFEGFFVNEGEGAPYFLGVTFALFEGQEMDTCAVANPYIETQKVVEALLSFAKLGQPDEDETQMGQRSRLWFTDDFAQGSFIILTDAEPMGYGGATLSISAPSEK